jgi:hypothetical protein
MKTITVCNSCSAGIANDDWSHLDYHATSQEEADEAHASITGTLELLGFLCYCGPADEEETGCYRCPVCGKDYMGPGELWESCEDTSHGVLFDAYEANYEELNQ